MVFRSPYPDIAIPEVDLLTFLFDRKNGPPKGKAAFIDSVSGETITYAELITRVNNLAAGLHAHGIRERDVVGIYAPNHIEYGIFSFAALRLGAAVTTANPTYTPGELNFQLSDSNAKLLVTIPDLLENARKAIPGTKVKEIFVFGNIGVQDVRPIRSLETFANPPQVTINNVRDRTCFICYSSGTTGRPKGVELTHYNIVSNVLQVYHADKESFRDTDVWCAVLPLYHCYALILVLCVGLHTGISIVYQSKFDLEQYLKIVQTYKITLAHIVPPIILGLAKSPLVDKYDLSSLRVIFSGAAPLGRDVEDEVRKRLGCVVKQGYGMTELSPVSHMNPSDPSKIVSGSIGYLIANQEAKIVDPVTGKELGVEEEGELWVRGPNVMKGYLNRPDATAETIDKDGFLHTGDVAKVDKNGYFYITDRLKELIKVKGLQVAPAELEAYLLTHPAVADSAVIGVPDERAGEAPKAFVTIKPGFTKDEKLAKEIIAFIEKKVAPHKRLRGGIEFMDVIPKSPSGKILRRILKDLQKAPTSKL